jgi:ABC-type branched-subunit amino acid transport system ATPase component
VAAALLEARALRKRFGGVTAVERVSFAVAPGEIRSIIGPNGAGKTTIFNVLSGLLSADGGEVVFRGRSLARTGPARRAALGIGRTFQNLQIFADMTVLENVMVGRHRLSGCGLVAGAFRLPRARREEAAIRAAADEALAFVGLQDRAGDVASILPFGQQRLLEIARALAMEPALLLLDEPAAGLNPAEVERLADLIEAIRARGVTVLLVEHHMDLVMRVSSRIVVLHRGVVLAEGTAAEMQRDPAVVDAYLGVDVDA